MTEASIPNHSTWAHPRVSDLLLSASSSSLRTPAGAAEAQAAQPCSWSQGTLQTVPCAQSWPLCAGDTHGDVHATHMGLTGHRDLQPPGPPPLFSPDSGRWPSCSRSGGRRIQTRNQVDQFAARLLSPASPACLAATLSQLSSSGSRCMWEGQSSEKHLPATPL